MCLCSVPPPPSNIAVVFRDQNQITFNWTQPPNSEEYSYSLRIRSDFWGHSHSATVRNKSSHTFSGLKSGTKYELELRTLVSDVSSDPINYSNSTGETHRDRHTLKIPR